MQTNDNEIVCNKCHKCIVSSIVDFVIVYKCKEENKTIAKRKFGDIDSIGTILNIQPTWCPQKEIVNAN